MKIEKIEVFVVGPEDVHYTWTEDIPEFYQSNTIIKIYTDNNIVGEAGVWNGTYFEYDKYNLSASAVSDIRALANSIKSSSSKVRIEGHCDERGTREYNLALGEKRANAVSELLQVNGVSSNSITTVSYGEEKPVAYGSNESSWSKNRRAVVKVL